MYNIWMKNIIYIFKLYIHISKNSYFINFSKKQISFDTFVPLQNYNGKSYIYDKGNFRKILT